MKKTTKKVGSEVRTTGKTGAAPKKHTNFPNEVEKYEGGLSLGEWLVFVAVAVGIAILIAHPFIMASF